MLKNKYKYIQGNKKFQGSKNLLFIPESYKYKVKKHINRSLMLAG